MGAGLGIPAAPRTRRLRLLLLVLLCVSLDFGGLFRSDAAAALPKQEVAALKQIAKELGHRKWNFTIDPCSGTGGWNETKGEEVNSVTCDCSYNNRTVCHITSILLKNLNLSGVLPAEFANLTFLRVLDLTRNYLNGSLPAAWASLSLTDLSILGNRVSGSIPKEFGNMKNLTSLVLEANQLEGPLPPALGNLATLERFRIHGNNLSGKIPDFIKSWTRLSSLMIFGTSMEGPIPESISSLTNLTDLRITDIGGPGSQFPPLQDLQNIKTLILRNCLLSGPIPDYIGRMAKLKTLDLSFNNLSGEVPESFDDLKKLDFLYLTSNKLTGSVPTWTSISQKNLDLSNNTFTGAPSSSCSEGNLNLIGAYSSMKDNSINSCLRKDFPCSKKAKYYNLFINCGGVEYEINETKYEADVMRKGAAMSFIEQDSHWAFSSSGNFMGDHFDADEYIVTSTSKLNTSNSELYTSARVSPLALTYYGFCLQNGNYNVSLHFAEIVFTDDQTFSSLGKRIFDVSIQGKLVLKDFNIEEEAGGPGRALIRSFNANVTSNTIEIQFYWAGKGTISIPNRGVYGPLVSAISVTPNFEPEIESENGLKIPVIAIVMIVISGCIILFLILVILRMRGWLGGGVPEDKELRGRLEKQTGYFTLKQIKAATKNFDAANKIGEGGFGPVYKGVLPDGEVIAVKVLSSKSKQGNREFVNEIGMISALLHPNLVKLLGCCIEGNQLMLVYEYMENNSLANALFGSEAGSVKLDWPTRCKICIGIARGLAYLHEESRLRVVHRDIKATNVLLDKGLNAKISDFGLAKLEEEGKTHISTRIAGTIGYMAPEYAMRGYLTDKADIYSFGVVAMEIVSGKSNTNYRPKDECVYLLDWVKRIMIETRAGTDYTSEESRQAYVLQEKGRLLDLVDPSLGTNYSKEEALRMLKVSLLCTSPSPTLRPSMSTVVSMLEGRAAVHEPAAPISGVYLSDDWRLRATSASFLTDAGSLSPLEPQTEVTEQWNDEPGSLSARAEQTTLTSNNSCNPHDTFEIDVK
ncbi:putative LRR receptor-like serine/threonine-protein kinase [Nymphaea thermarum]|nr:putative LRR receptor-like serine/threonine-protein kinase [Nymphaea thermarum]